MEFTLVVIVGASFLSPVAAGLLVATWLRGQWSRFVFWLPAFYATQHCLIYHLVLLLLGIRGFYTESEIAQELACLLALLPLSVLLGAGLIARLKVDKALGF